MHILDTFDFLDFLGRFWFFCSSASCPLAFGWSSTSIGLASSFIYDGKQPDQIVTAAARKVTSAQHTLLAFDRPNKRQVGFRLTIPNRPVAFAREKSWMPVFADMTIGD
jgi:hypothetical protein